MSSQVSFHTAYETHHPSSSQTAVRVELEQPAATTTARMAATAAAAARPAYRPAKPLPYELREHCLIYFEEELCELCDRLLLRMSCREYGQRPKSS